MLATKPDLPESLHTISILQLQLSLRTTNALRKGNILTVGHLVNAYPQDLTQMRGIGVNAIGEIQRALTTLTTCINSDITINWNQYYIKMGIEQPMSAPNSIAKLNTPLLPDYILPLSIGQLHLAAKSHNALIRANITTIRDALDAFEHRFRNIDGFGSNSIDLLTQRLQGLAEAVTDEGLLDWFAYWHNQQITVIPKGFHPGAPTEQIVKQLPGIIKEILIQDNEDRDWRIIERRFGLNRKQHLTLEEIGQTFGLTRERVRQIEKKALIELRNVLVLGQYIGRNYHIHPEISATIKILFDAIATQVTELIPETKLFKLAEEVWQTSTKEIKPVLILLFSLAEMDRIEFTDRDLTPLWGLTHSEQREQIVKVVSQIDHLLTNTTGQAMDEFDLLRHINKDLPKTQKITPLQLRRFLEFCNTVEQREDGLYQGRFRFLKQRGHQAERLLLESGKSLDAAEMTREINSRTVPFGAKKLELRNLINQMTADNRFISIGRSRHWVLKTWEHIDTASIVDLMERCLIERNTPTTVDEIYDYINNRRPATASSIGIYLSSRNDLFRRVDRTHWGLASWSEAKNTWRPDEVGSFVVDFFRKQKTKEIEFNIISKALSEAANISQRQAQGMLNVNPVVQTRREGSGKIYAILQPDYREELKRRGARFTRKQATLGDKITQIVRDILERQPDKEMMISELVNILIKQHNYKRHTAYNYLNRIDFIEKVAVPNSRAIICRIKNQSRLTFPRIEEIADSNIRDEIRRAVDNLTINNVDIGLFLLGRQFEVVIRNALSKGSLKGTIILPTNLGNEPAKWKLVSMVDGARQCGLITDLGVVNLLRQERNERAHGDPPSLEERQALMDSIQFLADLYINYIAIFSKYEQNWS